MRETESGCIPDIGYQEGWFAAAEMTFKGISRSSEITWLNGENTSSY